MPGTVPSSSTLAAELETDAAARDSATACKRKLQRIRGAIELLNSLDAKADSIDLPAMVLEAEADTTREHEELAGLLEQCDGGAAGATGGTLARP